MKKPKKEKNKFTSYDETKVVLGIDHFQGPFAVIILGWLAGFIILAIELIIPKCVIMSKSNLDQ